MSEFLLTAADAGRLHAARHACRNAIKPVGKQLRSPYGAGFLNQNQKRRLERIVGCIGVDQEPPTEAKHHWPVALHEHRKRHIVFVLLESVQQFAIGKLPTARRIGQPADFAEHHIAGYWFHVSLRWSAGSLYRLLSSNRSALPPFLANSATPSA